MNEMESSEEINLSKTSTSSKCSLVSSISSSSDECRLSLKDTQKSFNSRSSSLNSNNDRFIDEDNDADLDDDEDENPAQCTNNSSFTSVTTKETRSTFSESNHDENLNSTIFEQIPANKVSN